VKSGQEDLIRHVRKELGISEDTEHLVDWLLDAWSTLDMLRERFDEARAWQLYTASASLPQAKKRRAILV
jgi:hypothetical protein